MRKIEWKIGPARLRNGEECEIVAVLPSGRPVVSSGPIELVYCLSGLHPNGAVHFDLMPPRERAEGCLWILKESGVIFGAGVNIYNSEKIQSIPITLERDGPGSDWEIVK